MNQNKKPLINVTDLAKYMYCPRQFYLEKIVGVKKPVTKEMIEGRIRHEILEIFSDNERSVIESLDKIENDFEIRKKFEGFLKEIIKDVLERNKKIIDDFKIDSNEVEKRAEKQINKEIELRVKAIESTLKKGFFGKELWENLEPKYYSEFMVFSNSLGLKGRVDRLVIDKKEIIPFELKSREMDRVFESDEIQVAAYVMLLEHYFDRKIDFGVLEAGDARFQIDVDDKKRKKVLEIINEIQANLSKKFPSSFAKCEKCGFKKECDELDR
jgi:CRISPR-associated protein Cas4